VEVRELDSPLLSQTFHQVNQVVLDQAVFATATTLVLERLGRVFQVDLETTMPTLLAVVAVVALEL
jgi:hypothetical protein